MKIEEKIIVLAILGFFVVPICTGIISCYYFSKSYNKKVEVRKHLDIKDNSMLSVYLETEEGSGEYRLSEEDVFSHVGYNFNNEKSKCENGGKLTYNKENDKISMSTNASDKCFVYFDKAPRIEVYDVELLKSLNGNYEYLNDRITLEIKFTIKNNTDKSVKFNSDLKENHEEWEYYISFIEKNGMDNRDCILEPLSENEFIISFSFNRTIIYGISISFSPTLNLTFNEYPDINLDFQLPEITVINTGAVPDPDPGEDGPPTD